MGVVTVKVMILLLLMLVGLEAGSVGFYGLWIRGENQFIVMGWMRGRKGAWP